MAGVLFLDTLQLIIEVDSSMKNARRRQKRKKEKENMCIGIQEICANEYDKSHLIVVIIVGLGGNVIQSNVIL